MSLGFGSLPSFASGDDQNPLSPALQQYLQQQAQQQAQAPTMASQDVPAAVPPGYSGFNPQTPPTGAPTPVVQPGAQAASTGLLSMLGPNSAEAATPDPSDIRGRFISTLQQGGLTNPNGLGAVAAYAQHESRYSPSNITGSWSDPSESGQAGQSGGILSWRADRLVNMKAFTQGAADPVVAQAKFTLAENPALIQGLQNASSPEEAHHLMADAWKFAGYNRPGGENAARLATTQAYANSFGGGGQALPAVASGSSSQMSPGIARPAGASMGSTAGAGAFGLGGIQAQGAPVPGQSSPTPDVASLSGQPLTATGTQDQQPGNQYAQIGNALKSIAGGQQKQAQGGGGAMRAPEVGGRPMSLQQARAMFDSGKFYSTLRNAGVRGV